LFQTVAVVESQHFLIPSQAYCCCGPRQGGGGKHGDMWCEQRRGLCSEGADRPLQAYCCQDRSCCSGTAAYGTCTQRYGCNSRWRAEGGHWQVCTMLHRGRLLRHPVQRAVTRRMQEACGVTRRSCMTSDAGQCGRAGLAAAGWSAVWSAVCGALWVSMWHGPAAACYVGSLVRAPAHDTLALCMAVQCCTCAWGAQGHAVRHAILGMQLRWVRPWSCLLSLPPTGNDWLWVTCLGAVGQCCALVPAVPGALPACLSCKGMQPGCWGAA
jgi:hypothetical protein